MHKTEIKIKPRICQVVRHAKIAGTEKHVYLLAKGLDRSVFETHVCTFEDGDLVWILKDEGIRVLSIPKSHSIMHFVKLVEYFRRFRFDIVHCHSGGYAGVAARLAGIRCVIDTKHGIGFTNEELQSRNFVRRFSDFVVDRCVNAYIALTNYDKYVMTQILRIKADKITIISNGIDPSFADIKSAGKVDYPVIGTVGRLTEQKGIRYFIEAVPAISEVFPKIKVLIAGSGEGENELRSLAERMGVAKKVQFLGYTANIAEVMNRMNIFVLPSVWEGFPYVLLEAMLLKRPIVATDIFGINEIVQHGKSGILVKPRDPKAIAAAVVFLLSKKTKSCMLGIAAYKRVMQRFTTDKTLLKIEQLYRSLL
jgi:glycosyltransferase involved in cell wall biosynthesis